MPAKKNLYIVGISIVLCTVWLIHYSCSVPPDPSTSPNSVTINIILPDTVSHIVYTKEIENVTIVTYLSSFIDSVKLTVGDHDTMFVDVSDTVSIDWTFSDTGNIQIAVTAYCEKGIVKSSNQVLYVHKNPLVPPDSVYLQAQTDSSILIYWLNVPVAKKYKIYIGLEDSSLFIPLKTVKDTFCLSTTLVSNTTYYYKISILDSLNRESDLSPVYHATTKKMSLQKWDELIWDQNNWE